MSRLEDSRAEWDAAADGFDAEADHGLRAPHVRAAWAALLDAALGPGPLRVADLGCGTGSLSLLLHERGDRVTGLDLSPRMLARAREKTAGAVDFVEGDAARPELPRAAFGAVLCRHVLWALPDPGAVLARWAGLLAPGGRILLVEGHWHTGAGLTRAAIAAALPEGLRVARARDLSGDAALWGGPVTDDRFLMVLTRSADLPGRRAGGAEKE